jgi:hypothetical protein
MTEAAGRSVALPRWRVVPALTLGTLMATLDISAVNIALPTLSREFGLPLTAVEWVVLAYVLAITGLLLIIGRLADRAGRRRGYLLGLAIFTASSGAVRRRPLGRVPDRRTRRAGRGRRHDDGQYRGPRDPELPTRGARPSARRLRRRRRHRTGARSARSAGS